MSNVNYRFFYRQAPRLAVYRAPIEGLRPDDFITVSASEARADEEYPGRFVGGARPILVGSVASHPGYIEFSTWWTRINVPYLDLWVDVTVLRP